MSKDRIYGSSCIVYVYGANGPMPFLEVENFSAKSDQKLDISYPLGQVRPHGQLHYGGGWTLTFKGVKVDESFDQVQLANDSSLLAGAAAPRYSIVETTTYFDGSSKQWTYMNALLHGFNRDNSMSNEQIKQDFTGWADARDDGSLGQLGINNSI